MPRDYRAAQPETSAPPFPCPGSHNDAWRAEETDDPEHENNPPHRGDPIWCETCTTRTRSILHGLPHLAAALATEIEEATSLTAERVSGTRQRPIHDRQAQAFLIDEIRDVLCQWEDEIRAQRQFPPRATAGVRRETAITNASAFLAEHLTWILGYSRESFEPQGLVRAFVDRVARIDRRGQRMTHQEEARPQMCLGVRCKECDWLALARAVDKSGAYVGEVKCLHCAARMTLQQYAIHTAQWAAYEHALLTDEERVRLGPVVAAYLRSRGHVRGAA